MFKIESHLTQRYRTHKWETTNACEVFDKQIAQKSHLVQLQAAHIKLKPYSCQYCDKTFTSKESLNKNHDESTAYECDVSLNVFSSKTIRDLKRHHITLE